MMALINLRRFWRASNSIARTKVLRTSQLQQVTLTVAAHYVGQLQTYILSFFTRV